MFTKFSSYLLYLFYLKYKETERQPTSTDLLHNYNSWGWAQLKPDQSIWAAMLCLPECRLVENRVGSGSRTQTQVLWCDCGHPKQPLTSALSSHIASVLFPVFCFCKLKGMMKTSMLTPNVAVEIMWSTKNKLPRHLLCIELMLDWDKKP